MQCVEVIYTMDEMAEVCCIHVQNGIRSNSASSIMAGLNIDQSDVCMLAFIFFTETSYMRICFINTVCEKRS